MCLGIILAGCSGRRGVVEIRVVATTDVHGHIFDKDILDGTERKGSLAKVATLLKNERKKNKNVIYLDAGDILRPKRCLGDAVGVAKQVTPQWRNVCAIAVQKCGIFLAVPQYAMRQRQYQCSVSIGA